MVAAQVVVALAAIAGSRTYRRQVQYERDVIPESAKSHIHLFVVSAMKTPDVMDVTLGLKLRRGAIVSPVKFWEYEL